MILKLGQTHPEYAPLDRIQLFDWPIGNRRNLRLQRLLTPTKSLQAKSENKGRRYS